MRERLSLVVAIAFLGSVAASCSAPTAVEPVLDLSVLERNPGWTGHVETLFFPRFLGGRKVWVYLPPGYDPKHRRYPVLYLHDGESAFEPAGEETYDAGIDEWCEAMIRSGDIEPLIVVAISFGSLTRRFFDFTPYPNCPGYEYCEGCREGGGLAYLYAIQDIVKPYVDRRYATLSGPDHTFMAGASLGGLISLFAGYQFPETFGGVGGFSGSYGWGCDLPFLNFVSRMGKPPRLRVYVDTGTVNDNLFYAQILRGILLSKGFVEGRDFLYFEAEGHEHRQRDFAKRIPLLLSFLVGTGKNPWMPAPPPPAGSTALCPLAPGQSELP